MIPLFHTVDHRLPNDELLPWEARAPRRSQPARLLSGLPRPGAPVLTLQTRPPPEPIRAGGGLGLGLLARLFRKRSDGPAM